MALVRAYSRNLGQHSILARNGTFLKKGNQKFCVLHRIRYRSRICPAGSIKFRYFNNIISSIIWMLIEYRDDHKLDASIVPTF